MLENYSNEQLRDLVGHEVRGSVRLEPRVRGCGSGSTRNAPRQSSASACSFQVVA